MAKAWAYLPVCGTASASACTFGACMANGTCVCSPGFVSNNILIRVQDCSLPDWFFYLTMIGTMCFAFTGALYGSSLLRHTHGNSLRALRALTAAQCFLFLSSMIALIQANTGRAYFVFLGAFHFCIFVGFGYLILIFRHTAGSGILRAMHGRSVQREQSINMATRAYQFFGAAPLAFVVPLMALALGDESAPDYPIDLLNATVAWAHGVGPIIYLIIGTPLGIIASSDLLVILDASQDNPLGSNKALDEKMRNVKARIVLFRRFLMYFVPIGTLVPMTLLCGIAYSLRWPVIGYVMLVNLYSASLCVIVLMKILAPNRSQTMSQPSTSNGAAATIAVANVGAIGDARRTVLL